jgi:DNA modification methylase
MNHSTIFQHSWPDACPPGLVRQAAIVFADPPYNQGVKYEDDPTGDSLPTYDYQIMMAAWIFEISKMLRPGGTFWLMVPDRHADFVGIKMDMLVGPRVHRVIFEESFAQYQQKKLTEDFRHIFCHQVPGGPVTFNPDDIRIPSRRQEMGDPRADPRGRVPGCIWKMRRLQGTAKDRVSWHPTQLAPELLERIIRGWSHPGDTVVDAFAGSGVMAQVALSLGRNFVGFDRSPTYVRKISDRVQ